MRARAAGERARGGSSGRVPVGGAREGPRQGAVAARLSHTRHAQECTDTRGNPSRRPPDPHPQPTPPPSRPCGCVLLKSFALGRRRRSPRSAARSPPPPQGGRGARGEGHPRGPGNAGRPGSGAGARRGQLVHGPAQRRLCQNSRPRAASPPRGKVADPRHTPLADIFHQPPLYHPHLPRHSLRSHGGSGEA